MRAPSPRTLLAGSAVLFAAFAIGVFVTRRPAPPPPATTAPPPTAPAPPAPPPAVTASAFAAVVHTDARLVRWGPAGSAPLLWSPVEGGRALLSGLSPRTAYVADDGARRLEFTTPAIPPTVTARLRHGTIRVDGAPFFPLLTWQECPGAWNREIAEGINVFGGNPCTNLGELLTGVAGRALAAGTSDDVPGTTGPGLIGWFYPDEADGHGLTAATLPRPGPGLRFLTITSHFFAPAAPLPEGRGMYPGLVRAADVVGFDLYPLQELCRPELLPWVYDAQVALRRLAPTAATFQWIEVREMKCPAPDAAVTAATIRTEAWLAVAGGARGLGFFPADWHGSTGDVVRGIAARVRQLEPALLRPPVAVAVQAGSPAVRASARVYHGAVYLIAVNAGTTAAVATLTAPLLGDRRLAFAGRAGALRAESGVVTLRLPPESARIAVAPPVPSNG